MQGNGVTGLSLSNEPRGRDPEMLHHDGLRGKSRNIFLGGEGRGSNRSWFLLSKELIEPPSIQDYVHTSVDR